MNGYESYEKYVVDALAAAAMAAIAVGDALSDFGPTSECCDRAADIIDDWKVI